MLQNFKKILNSNVHASDGKIGHLDDILFDDEKWIARYIVVRTNGILNRKRVIISPLGIEQVDWMKQSVKLRLNRKQIEESPDVDTDRPVFRQMEKRYFDYYNWPYYWSDMSIWGIDSRNPLVTGEKFLPNKSNVARKQNTGGNPHLRSCREVSHYSIEVEKAHFGKVEDFWVEDETWKIRYLLIDTKTWMNSRSVLIDTDWVQSIDWGGRRVRLTLERKDIESSPEYVPNAPIDRSYEERLQRHYHH